MNVRSALKLGHPRGVAILAAVEAGCDVVEYTPAEIKRAVVGYGRAEKHQVQQMIKLLLVGDAAAEKSDHPWAGGRYWRHVRALRGPICPPSRFRASASQARDMRRSLGSFLACQP